MENQINRYIVFSGPPDCLCSDHFACKADEDDIVDRIFGVKNVIFFFKLSVSLSHQSILNFLGGRLSNIVC